MVKLWFWSKKVSTYRPSNTVLKNVTVEKYYFFIYNFGYIWTPTVLNGKRENCNKKSFRVSIQTGWLTTGRYLFCFASAFSLKRQFTTAGYQVIISIRIYWKKKRFSIFLKNKNTFDFFSRNCIYKVHFFTVKIYIFTAIHVILNYKLELYNLHMCPMPGTYYKQNVYSVTRAFILHSKRFKEQFSSQWNKLRKDVANCNTCTIIKTSPRFLCILTVL